MIYGYTKVLSKDQIEELTGISKSKLIRAKRKRENLI